MSANTIASNVDLQALNTLAVPAWADYYVALTEPAALPAILEQVSANGWPLRVLGEGSNVVLAERHAGLTLHQQCRGIAQVAETKDRVNLRVAAGENWHAFVDWSLQQGFCGLENLALIPGTVGAAPVQNIGAYGVEVGSFIEAVHCRDLHTGEPVMVPAQRCDFEYRYSVFKRGDNALLIEAVEFALPRAATPVLHYPGLASYLAERGMDAPKPREIFEAVVAIRRAKLPDPALEPNVGSFFKNPRLWQDELQDFLARAPGAPHFADGNGGYRLAAAWLIEQCGFKSLAGPVRVHPRHALVIINPQRQSAAAVLQLAEAIVDAVQERFGITLEQEPRNV